MPTRIEKDITGAETTGHEWDGIKELNNPLPTWWVYVFWASFLVSVLLWILYPSIPYGPGYFRGLLGYDQRAEGLAAVEQARLGQAVYLDRIAATGPAEILEDPELLAFALQGGKAAFGTNCAPCHAQGGAGQAGGYPALVDDDWLWGGTIDAVYHTVQYGIRSGHDEAHMSEMPSFRGILDAQQMNEVAAYVLSLAGLEHDEAAAEAGAPVFAENCAVCHGEAGGGSIEMGAPALDDAIWLYGGTRADILAQMQQPKHGMMPAWFDRLPPETLKMLAVYVHSLGGGQIEPVPSAAAEASPPRLAATP